MVTRNYGQNYTLRKKLQFEGKNYIIRSFIIHLSRRTKSRYLRLPGHVASMGDIKYVHKTLVGIADGKNNLIKFNMDEMTTIKRILNWLSGCGMPSFG